MRIWIVIGIVIGILMLPLVASTADARDHKVLLCHATGSESNPYVRIEIARAALDAHTDEDGNLHGDRLGNRDFFVTEDTPCPPVTTTPNTPSNSTPTTTPSNQPSTSVATNTTDSQAPATTENQPANTDPENTGTTGSETSTTSEPESNTAATLPFTGPPSILGLISLASVLLGGGIALVRKTIERI